MKAFVLAGGLGTRLRPHFGDLPKPLAPLAGRPILERQLAWLGGHGIREVVLCVGHGADRVEAALGDGHAHGVRLHYSRESEPLRFVLMSRRAARFPEGARRSRSAPRRCISGGMP